MQIQLQPRSLLTLLFAGLFGYVVVESLDMPFQARLYPWTVGLIGLALLLWQLVREVFFSSGPNDAETGADMDFTAEEGTRQGKARAVELFGWLYGFALALWLIGFYAAIPLLVLLYLMRHNERPLILILLPGCTGAITWLVFGELLHLPFPPGLVIEWLGFD